MSEQLDTGATTQPSGPKFSAQGVTDFMRARYPVGPWTVTAIYAQGALESETVTDYKHWGNALRWLRERAPRANLYWQVNPLRCTLGKGKAKALFEDVARLERLHVDLDVGPKFPGTLAEQRERILALLQDEPRLKELGLPGGPTYIVDSGGGYWAFWELVVAEAINEPTVQLNREKAHRLGGHNKWLADKLNAALGAEHADACHNIDRIARLPGSVNYPDDKKRAFGRTEALATTVAFHQDRLYELIDFDWVEVGEAGACDEELAKIIINYGNHEAFEGDGDSWEVLDLVLADFPLVQPTTRALILLGKDTDLSNNIIKSRSEAHYLVNRALQHAGVPLDIVVRILADKRFKVSEHIRFPAGTNGIIASRPLSDQEVWLRTERQVKKAHWKIERDKLALKAQAAAEAVLADGAPQDAVEPKTDSEATQSAKPDLGFGPFPPGMKLNDIFRIMNKRHAVLLQEGGKTLVLSWEKKTDIDYSREVPVLQTFADFRNRYLHQKVQVGTDKNGNPKMESIGKFWLEHPNRREHLAMRFLPGEGEVVDGYLNLWKGFAVEPKQGDCNLIKRHVVEVLADGNEEYAQYILKWSGWAVQNPDKQAEVAVVFKGPRGIGKGSYANLMKNLFGQHGLHINNTEHLTGKFNSHLQDCCFLFADEAVAPNNSKAEAILKGLITEPEIAIERKRIDVTQTRNRLHIMMASNDEWVIPAGMDERRFAVFQTASEKRPKEYYDALKHQIENGGMEAFLYELLHMELEGWHPRYDVPQTKALQEQKEESLAPEEQFILGILEEGVIPGAKMGEQPNVVYSNDTGLQKGLFNSMRDASPRLRTVSDKKLGAALRKWGCVRASDGAARGWRFPELDEMRKLWEKRFGAHEWEEYPEWASDVMTTTPEHYAELLTGQLNGTAPVH